MYIDIGDLIPVDPPDGDGDRRVHGVQVPPEGFDWPLAFRALNPLGARAVRGLAAAVHIRRQIGPQDLAIVDQMTTWPLAVVTSEGNSIGTLTRLLPSTFYVDAQRSGQRTRQLLEFQLLCASQEYAKGIGVDLRPFGYTLTRLALLAQLAHVLEILHRNAIVYGDLNLQDVAFAVGAPRISLLNCEGVSLLSDSARVQTHSPFFTPPEAISGKHTLQDHTTDVFKLGLCVLRVLAPGRGSAQLSDPTQLSGVLDDAGVTLIAAALSPNRSDRPLVSDLRGYLHDVVVANAPSELLGFPTGHVLPTVVTRTQMPRVTVFISYRRSDTFHATARLYEHLTRELGSGSLFMDVDDIQPGDDFEEVIKSTIKNCKLVLVIIGPDWLSSRHGPHGTDLDRPDDFVRLEIETAFHNKIPILPILMDSATMPSADRLPPTLAGLARTQAAFVRQLSFGADCRKVAEQIRKRLGTEPMGTTPGPFPTSSDFV